MMEEATRCHDLFQGVVLFSGRCNTSLIFFFLLFLPLTTPATMVLTPLLRQWHARVTASVLVYKAERSAAPGDSPSQESDGGKVKQAVCEKVST